jgi:hypothetical protein
MNLNEMSREELIRYIQDMNEYMDNVIVFWGGKREFKETFREVAENKDSEYTKEEVKNAGVLVNSEEAFNEFVQMVRDSFERGGISYVLSEKISALMEEVATKRG